MKAILVFLIVAIIARTWSQTCEQNESCDNCASVNGCGWCAPTQQCLPGTKAGPLNSTCIGKNWEYGVCTPCEKFTDCRSCLVYDQDCFWCNKTNGGLGGCKFIGFVGCPYTRTCPCNIYSDCSSCADDATCQWCATDEMCVAIGGNCNVTGPVYNYTNTCPCNVNNDCPTCRGTLGCNWCQNGECQETCAGPVSLSCQVYCSEAGATCDNCNANEGCAWCAGTIQCVDPTVSQCFFTHTCPQCQSSSFCDTCLSNPECTWCSDSGTCQQQGAICNSTLTCENYCQLNGNCESCNQVRGCGWCSNLNKCEDINTANCFFSHTCQTIALNCGFNGGAFVGGMFLMLAVFILIGAAYWFYRWKTGRKVQYSELR